MLEAASYGAMGDGTECSASLQKAVNAAANNGDWLHIGPGTFPCADAVTIPGHVKLTGCGFQTNPINYGYGDTLSTYDLRSSGFMGTTLLGSPGKSILQIRTADSLSIDDMMFSYAVAPDGTSSAAAVDVGTSSNQVNIGSSFRRLFFNNASKGLQLHDCVEFEVNFCRFVANILAIECFNSNSTNFAGCTTAATCGDGTITKCTFLASVGTSHINILSGSGYRIVNNKFNGIWPLGGSAGKKTVAICFNPRIIGLPAGQTYWMTPMVINDNSIEGCDWAISAGPQWGSEARASLWTICGNELFTACIEVLPGADASGQNFFAWLSGVNITGNVINWGYSGQPGTSCIVLEGANAVNVAGNTFSNEGGTTNITYINQLATQVNVCHTSNFFLNCSNG